MDKEFHSVRWLYAQLGEPVGSTEDRVTAVLLVGKGNGQGVNDKVWGASERKCH